MFVLGCGGQELTATFSVLNLTWWVLPLFLVRSWTKLTADFGRDKTNAAGWSLDRFGDVFRWAELRQFESCLITAESKWDNNAVCQGGLILNWVQDFVEYKNCFKKMSKLLYSLISKCMVVVKWINQLLAGQYFIRLQKQSFIIIVRQTHVGFLLFVGQ